MAALTKEEFSRKYGKTNVPVVLEGVTESWKAKEKWKWMVS